MTNLFRLSRLRKASTPPATVVANNAAMVGAASFGCLSRKIIDLIVVFVALAFSVPLTYICMLLKRTCRPSLVVAESPSASPLRRVSVPVVDTAVLPTESTTLNSGLPTLSSSFLTRCASFAFPFLGNLRFRCPSWRAYIYVINIFLFLIIYLCRVLRIGFSHSIIGSLLT